MEKTTVILNPAMNNCGAFLGASDLSPGQLPEKVANRVRGTWGP